ncbi:MAG: NADH-quinone oxidoreductase subunit N [Candidatus Magnetoovum sp. WYHC-5]|nr:NADH-quinone oxidoreductase subunit N [Candidatus Magnetoovum sp. WYHC-5]
MQVPDLIPVVPEILMTILVLSLLVIDLFIKQKEYIAVYTVVGSLLVIISVFYCTGVTFKGMFVADSYSIFFKMIFLINVIFAAIISVEYLKKRASLYGEYYVLLVFATIGMMIMASAGNLIVLYLGLELMALSTYVLAGIIRTDGLSTEAAVKYFLLGAFSSAILLYGISLLYGITGSLDIREIGLYIAKEGIINNKLLLLGLVFFITSFGFKIAAAPFHMWTPDVYHGAPTSITAFMSVGPKAAAFAIFGRVFMIVFPALSGSWVNLLIPIAILTMAVGNIVALAQTNIKRMLAYSSIAHAGYALLGIIAASNEGLSAMMNYMLIYLFMNVGAFILVIMLNNQAKVGDSIHDYRGLSKSNPLAAFLMLIIMFSLTGIPPTAGFMGKLYLFMAVVNAGYGWLAVVAVIFSAISAFYYLRIVMFMFMNESIEEVKLSLVDVNGLLLIIVVFMVLFIGVNPQPFVELARLAIL